MSTMAEQRRSERERRYARLEEKSRPEPLTKRPGERPVSPYGRQEARLYPHVTKDRPKEA